MEADILDITPEIFCRNAGNYLQTLEDNETWRKIPLLNYTRQRDLENLKIFRFRGMVQDMSNPEIYLQSYEIQSGGESRMQNGKYRDCLPLEVNENINYDSQANVLGERRCMLVVSIPSINKWTKDYESNITKTNANYVTGNRSLAKRPSENCTKMEIDSVEVLGTKKVRCEETVGSVENKNSHVVTKEHILQSAIPELSNSCLVKIYDDFDSYTLNSILDVIGFISLNTNHDSEDCNEDDMETERPQNDAPSQSIFIPTLHAIAIKKLQHANPLLDPLLSIDDRIDGNIERMQKDLKIALTQCLFGDDIAADYLLLNLISTIFVRTDLETLGKFSLNIYNIPSEVLPEYTTAFYEVIELLLPASHYVSMTLQNLNTIQFVPKKDYKTNKLVSGILQLAPHTHLVLDETRLETGKLETKGVEAIRNLNYLIKTQQIKCDFQFYQLDFNVNIPVLILSEGKSMLPSDCQIPLNVDKECMKLIPETLKAVKHYLQPKLNSIRKYLTWAKLHEFTVDPETTTMIEKDFVQTRETNKKFGADELHKLLVLSRLLGISKGKSLLDKDTWCLAKTMEIERYRRIQ